MIPDCTLLMPAEKCGIYHVIRDGKVIYVGQSTNLMSRLGNHPYTEYDEVHLFYCPQEELNRREREDIERLLPELNVEHMPREYLKKRITLFDISPFPQPVDGTHWRLSDIVRWENKDNPRCFEGAEQWMTVRELANRYRTTKKRIWQWTRQGKTKAA